MTLIPVMNLDDRHTEFIFKASSIMPGFQRAVIDGLSRGTVYSKSRESKELGSTRFPLILMLQCR
jgi:hypothetical protein